MSSTISNVTTLINLQKSLATVTTTSSMTHTPTAAIVADIKEDEESAYLEKLKSAFNEYAASQKDFVPPVADIDLQDGPERDQIEVYIDVAYEGVDYHFESIKYPESVKNMHEYLNSQTAVISKFDNGKTRTIEQTEAAVKKNSEKFKRTKDKNADPYSCLVVTDNETNSFIGVAALNPGKMPGTAETARLNRMDVWSNLSKDIVKEYVEKPAKQGKQYKGVGTVEACVLLQYAAFLKNKGYPVNGHTLETVVATARIDNFGSWKSHAKVGMKLTGISRVEELGKDLRYHLAKNIS